MKKIDPHVFTDPLMYYQVDPEFDEVEFDLIDVEHKQLYVQEIENVPF